MLIARPYVSTEPTQVGETPQGATCGVERDHIGAVRLPGPIARIAEVGDVAWVADWQNGVVVGVDIHTLCPFVSIEAKAIALVAVEHELWLADFTLGGIRRLDGTSGSELGRLEDIRAGGGLAYDGSRVWAVCCGIDSDGEDPVTIIEPGQHEVVSELSVERGAGIHFGFNSAWIGRLVPSGLYQVSADGTEIVRELDLPGGVVRDVQVTDSAVLVADGGARVVHVVDPDDLELIGTLQLDLAVDQAIDISVRGQSDTWAAGSGASYVFRLRDGEFQPAVSMFDESPEVVEATDRYVWIGTEAGLLIRVDPTAWEE